MFNPAPVIRADYRRNRLLVIVTLTLIALAVALGVAVISQERALRQGSARAADDFDLLLGAPGSPTQLVLSTIYLQARAVPLLDGAILLKAATSRGVRYAAPIAFGDNVRGYPVVGTIAAFASRGDTLLPSEGRLFAGRGEAVVGANVKFALGSEIVPSHGTHHDADEAEARHPLHYTVVGRLPERGTIWDKAILVPIEDVWAIHGLPTGHAAGGTRIGPPWDAAQLPGVPAIAVKPESVAAAYYLRAQFKTRDSLAVFPAEVLNELYATLGDVRDLLALLALATQVLVIIAVLLALLVGFLARRRQFAVLRAIGASRRYVFTVIWLEVGILIAAGSVSGLMLGWGGAQGLSWWLARDTGFALPVTLGGAELGLCGLLALCGFVLALLPASLGLGRSIAAGLRG